MPDCDYCDSSFDGESEYENHLGEEHYDELSRIDRRRVDGPSEDDSDGPALGIIVLGVSLLGAAVVIGAVVFFQVGGASGSVDAEQEPAAAGTSHHHGTIEMVVNGEPVDFSLAEYQLQDDRFHFESGNGDRWHAHAQGVTLEYAMATLDIEVTENSVTYRGTTYRDGDSGTSVTVTVNGESVVPSQYVLQAGDNVQIIVEQS